jgi:formylglycine-generating enzyme required for sulfatase activity
MNQTQTLELETGTLCRVPRGPFTMGSDDPEARPGDRPAHRVLVADYYIDRTMVTNRLFARFCDETGYRTVAERLGLGETVVDGEWRWIQGACWRHPEGPGSTIDQRLDHPVVLVSAGDALAFCGWRSQVEGRRFRLPTEAEWEKAARGEDGRTYPWGEEEPDDTRARFNAGDAAGTAPVGAFPAGASPCGALDMAGNAWDWCLDAWDERLYRRWRRSSVRADRGGPLTLAAESVFKGGSWIFPAEALRSSGRHHDDLVRPSGGIGFRTVHPAEESMTIRVVERVRRVAHWICLQRWRRRKEFD